MNMEVRAPGTWWQEGPEHGGKSTKNKEVRELPGPLTLWKFGKMVNWTDVHLNSKLFLIVHRQILVY